MFPRNNPGPTKSATKDKNYIYPLLHIQKDRSTTVNCYVKREPYYHGQNKFIMPMSRSFVADNVVISSDDYDDATVCVSVKNKTQINNIKSFLFSEYFVDFVEKWKKKDGYGFNEAIKYFPKFDKDKHWTNDEVKEFVESYVK